MTQHKICWASQMGKAKAKASNIESLTIDVICSNKVGNMKSGDYMVHVSSIPFVISMIPGVHFSRQKLQKRGGEVSHGPV